MKLEGYIELFLRRHHRWTIPGVGTLHRVYRDAYLDHRVQTAYPGEENLSFSPDESGDIKAWESFLHKRGGGAALQLWNEWFERSRANWEITGLLEVEGLFRLERKEQNIELKMLAAHGLGDWYGLPSLPFYPLNRELAIERMSLPKPKLPTGIRPEPFSFNKEILMPILATILALVAYIMIFTWPGNMVEGPKPRTTSNFEIDESKVNRAPEDSAMEDISEDSFYSDQDMVDRPVPEQRMPEDAMEQDEGLFDEEMLLEDDTPVMEQVPEEVLTRECVVIVGSFQRRSNIERMVQKLSEMGYQVYQEPGPRGLTRVGARLECLDEEVLDTLGFFRNKFVEDAWVLKW